MRHTQAVTQSPRLQTEAKLPLGARSPRGWCERPGHGGGGPGAGLGCGVQWAGARTASGPPEDAARQQRVQGRPRRAPRDPCPRGRHQQGGPTHRPRRPVCAALGVPLLPPSTPRTGRLPRQGPNRGPDSQRARRTSLEHQRAAWRATTLRSRNRRQVTALVRRPPGRRTQGFTRAPLLADWPWHRGTGRGEIPGALGLKGGLGTPPHAPRVCPGRGGQHWASPSRRLWSAQRAAATGSLTGAVPRTAAFTKRAVLTGSHLCCAPPGRSHWAAGREEDVGGRYSHLPSTCSAAQN